MAADRSPLSPRRVFEPERIAARVGRLAERADLAERGVRDRNGIVVLLLG